MFFAINPFEQDIETILITYINLENYMQIMDGEFHIGRNILIRRPVALIDIDWLRNMFIEHGTLGELISDPSSNSYGGKKLPPIPNNSIRLFVDDIFFRRKRLCSILQNNHIIKSGVKHARLISHLCGGNWEDFLQNIYKKDLRNGKEINSNLRKAVEILDHIKNTAL